MPEDYVYYVRDLAFCGNSCLWWMQYEAGYTHDLSKAGLYTKAFCDSLDSGLSDFFHKDDVDHLAESHVPIRSILKMKEGC